MCSVRHKSLFLLLHFLMHHGAEIRQDLVFSLGPLLTIEHGQGSSEEREREKGKVVKQI